MSEIRITISDLPRNSREELIWHIRAAIQNYDPLLKIHISESEDYLLLSSRKECHRLFYSKCRFIETDNRHLIFHCEDESFRRTGKISELLQRLPGDIFFRCNNSYIVNLYYISNITPEGDRYNIRLRSGEVIPLSRSRYRACRICLETLASSV